MRHDNIYINLEQCQHLEQYRNTRKHEHEREHEHEHKHKHKHRNQLYR